jgi:hypothetical protein
MKYKTVKDVIEFVRELRATDTVDNLLSIHLEFYEGDDFVGELDKNMYSGYIIISLIGKYLSDYFVTDFKIEMREYCIAFVLNIKNPSSI